MRLVCCLIGPMINYLLFKLNLLILMTMDLHDSNPAIDDIIEIITRGECPFTLDIEFGCKDCFFKPICEHPNTLLYG